jgi:hypothetical protein
VEGISHKEIMTTALDTAWLRDRLANDEISIYTAVVLARRDLAAGQVTSAIARLRSEADKLRMHDKELAHAVLNCCPE